MTSKQRQLLSEKLTANAQRRLAAEYLAALGADMRSTLAQSRLVVRPESDPIIAFRQFDKHGLQLEQAIRPTGYMYAHYDEPDEVYAAVRLFGNGADAALGYFCPTYFRSSADPPVFEVRFGWARAHFSALHALAGQGCNLTTRGGEAGILSRVTCGWHDRHADDRVHELACWGG
jgi:hypothetical protein